MCIDRYVTEYEVGPLYIKRLAYICQNFDITQKVIEDLLELIRKPDSPYQNYKDTPSLVALLPESVRAKYSLEQGNSVAYDDQIAQIAKHDPSDAVFEQILDLLHRRTVDILMKTGSSDSVSDNAAFYYSLGPELSSLSKKWSLRELQKFIIYKAYDGSLATCGLFLRRKLQQALEFERDDESDEDDKMAVDERVLDPEEAIAYWNCRWYLLYANFLGSDYQGVAEEYFRLEQEPAISGVCAKDVLRNSYSNELVFKDYLLRTVCFSILMVEKIQDLDSRWTELLKETLAADIQLKTLVNDYKKCRFKQLKTTLDTFQNEFDHDEQLSQGFRFWRQTFHHKIDLFYLSMMKRVSFDHIEQVLGTSKQELVKLVMLFKLRVKIDESCNVIEFFPANDQQDVLQHVNALNESVVAEMRALEVNKMVREAFE
ncbi:hypothetical protein OGAPHI_005588 [Ogataea philodendri]|uniref:PCI domain-containing protein n=1 Tax=Ogataea philodendri TaxID=1378263 RepID=A0A9P8NZW8_9ASCO|nr:uncharacterized protein OGAPHI_005588 [Ogataea philodendri]KAH3662336.1 hypothetical protein OGAPHI_005588 [Ogataea philodendri]